MATLEKRMRDTTGSWRTVPKSEWQKRHSGAHWRVKIRRKGAPMMTKTFVRKTDAQAWARKVETQIREGVAFGTDEARRRTVAELINRYKRDVCPGKKDGDKQARQLDWWHEELGFRLLKDLTPALVAYARDKLASQPTPAGHRKTGATVNRYLAALSHACTRATREWGWLDANPVRQVSRLPENKGKVRFLVRDERDRLLAVCRDARSAFLYPVVVLALATGMRKGEILKLRWADVDLEARSVVLHETKNGERRRVSLLVFAVDALRSWGKLRRLNDDRVFPITTGALDYAWQKARADAELNDFRFHDLRHTTASYLAMEGCSPLEIAEVLGHKSLAMVKRYAHLSEDHTKSVVERMNASLFKDMP